MMTLRRFKVLTEAYGADLRRWPASERAEAAMFLAGSTDARGILKDAQHLDVLIDVAHADEAQTLLQTAEQAAALARLRSGLAARIAPPSPSRKQRESIENRLSWVFASTGFGRTATASWHSWAVMTVGGGAALVAGLWIGAMHAAAGPVGLITMLQPSPLHGLVW